MEMGEDIEISRDFSHLFKRASMQLSFEIHSFVQNTDNSYLVTFNDIKYMMFSSAAA
jgi:hypothetical protein